LLWTYLGLDLNRRISSDGLAASRQKSKAKYELEGHNDYQIS